MGDKIVISNIEFLYGRLLQIDLHNESKDEWYRVFADREELYTMFRNAEGGTPQGEGGCIGCMCIECRHSDIVMDNHEKCHRICTRCESEYFLQEVSTAFGECDYGEVEMEDEE